MLRLAFSFAFFFQMIVELVINQKNVRKDNKYNYMLPCHPPFCMKTAIWSSEIIL